MQTRLKWIFALAKRISLDDLKPCERLAILAIPMDLFKGIHCQLALATLKNRVRDGEPLLGSICLIDCLLRLPRHWTLALGRHIWFAGAEDLEVLVSLILEDTLPVPVHQKKYRQAVIPLVIAESYRKEMA